MLSDGAQIYAAGVVYFGMNTALASISAFLPTILKTLGFSESPSSHSYSSL